MRLRSCLYLLALILPQTPFAANPPIDLRVVIDTSQRFAALDPDGHRAEGMRLLAGILPTGAQAGAWTYGRYVEQIAPPGRVDAAWRERALAGAGRIHANAGLADLERALARASEGWHTADAAARRILLLISASGVEPSADAERNAASRERLLTQTHAALVAAGAELHVVAVGAGADLALFGRLAQATGGAVVRTQQAQSLPRQLVELYARVARPNQIGLGNGEFELDAQVAGMTLVLFRDAAGKPPLLIPPDSPVISAARPRAARWQSSRDFELIRIERPGAGAWQLTAEPGAGSRLFVDGPLELRAFGPPADAMPGEPIEIAAELVRAGDTIRRNAFLRFVEFSLVHTGPDGAVTRRPLVHTGVRADKGRYLARIDATLAEGWHGFRIEARGSNFARAQEFATRVGWPVEIRIEAAAEPGRYEIRLRPREAFLRADGLAADVEVETPKGQRDAVPLRPADGWLAGRILTGQDGVHQARVRVSARRHDGTLVDLNLGPFALLGAATRAEAGLETPPPPPSEAPAAEPPGFDRKLAGIVIVGVNGTLLLAVLLIWLWSRRKRRLAAAADDGGAGPGEAEASSDAVARREEAAGDAAAGAAQDSPRPGSADTAPAGDPPAPASESADTAGKLASG